MNKIPWYEVGENNLPEHQQRVLVYQPTSLTKIKEVVFYNNTSDKRHFIDAYSYWSEQLIKPE